MISKQVFTFVFLSIIFSLFGQNSLIIHPSIVAIHPSSVAFYSESYISQIINACAIYRHEVNDRIGRCLLNVDFKVEQDSIIIVINREHDLLTILEKHPDCIIDINTENLLVLAHSINYKNINDSLWLKQVYDKVIHFIPNSRIRVVSWKENMFKIERRDLCHEIIEIYDPPIYKYIYVNNKIISKKEVNNYLFLQINKTKDADRPWTWR